MTHPLLSRVLLPILCACLAIILLTVSSPIGSAHAATTSAASCRNYNYAPGNFVLGRGSIGWKTCKGNTVNLNMQDDGNFVLYINGHPKWASNTSSLVALGDFASFDSDGALRVYDVNIFNSNATPYIAWSSNTNKKGATRLSLQDDGNMVIYTAAGKALWASHTSGY